MVFRRGLKEFQVILFLILFFLWAAVHSVTASRRFKEMARQRMGARAYDGMYRLLYNLLAVVTLLPVLIAGSMALPHAILWQISRPLNLLFVGIQLLGLAGLLVSLLQTDFMRFAGLGQFVRYLTGKADVNPQPVLLTGGAYKLVRHPLYFFSLLVLWFAPTMTISLLLFNVAATVYFWVGSGHEERRLSAVFGEQYDAYRKRVPRLLPVKLIS
jgi:protein-S-isoprenylcysteine O-methyltransferase Ste14